MSMIGGYDLGKDTEEIAKSRAFTQETLQKMYAALMRHAYFCQLCNERVIPEEWVEIIFKEAGLDADS